MVPLELKPRPWRLLLLLAGAVAFAAIGWVFAWFPHVDPHVPVWLPRIAGWVILIFSGACGLEIGRQLLNRRPRLVLSDEGLFDATMRTAPVPWSSILEAGIVAVRSNKFIALRLQDEAYRTAALPGWKRALGSANVSPGFGRFNVNVAALGVSAEWVLEQMKARAAAAGVRLCTREPSDSGW